MKEKNEQYSISRKQILVLLTGFLIPLFFGILLLYLIFGNLADAFQKMWELRGEPNRTKDALASLSAIWTTLLTIYGIIITAIFSYLVWKTSIGSLNVSKEIRNTVFLCCQQASKTLLYGRQLL